MYHRSVRGLGPCVVLLLIAALGACEAPCADCFELAVRGSEDGWEPCCSYARDNIQDPVFLRLTRVSGDRYTAGVQFGCRWSAETVTLTPTRVLVDGAGNVVDRGMSLEFTPGEPVVEVAVDCDAFRPAPQYPQVVVDLRDPDLLAQYADGDDGEVDLVLDWYAPEAGDDDSAR